MNKSRTLPLLFRHVTYNLRGGFLVRPLTVALALGCAGALLSWWEEAVPAVSAWVPKALFPSHADPQEAQVILAAIAASIMTVVSIVFAILLMTLTLASETEAMVDEMMPLPRRHSKAQFRPLVSEVIIAWTWPTPR